jgi:hypothetical protein
MPSIDPTIAANSRRSRTPSRYAARIDAHDTTFALRPSLEFRMPEETASILGDFKRPNIEVGQTHPVAAKSFREEVAVPTYERGVPQPSQQGNYLLICHSLATNIPANLAEVKTLPAQLCALALEDVFVQNKHAQTGLSR